MIPESQKRRYVTSLNVGFDSYRIDYEVGRVGKNLVVIEDGMFRALDYGELKARRGKTTKFKFVGLSRAQMGHVISCVKTDGMTTYSKAERFVLPSGKVKVAPYSQVLVKGD